MTYRLIIRPEAEVEEDSITVLAVFHAARDPKHWQDRV